MMEKFQNFILNQIDEVFDYVNAIKNAVEYNFKAVYEMAQEDFSPYFKCIICDKPVMM